MSHCVCPARIARISALTLALIMAWFIPARAATAVDLEQTCRDWIKNVATAAGGWGGSLTPSISGHWDLTAGDTLLARCYAIAPRGEVVVSVTDGVPTIRLYSDECRLASAEGELVASLRGSLLHEARSRNDLSASQSRPTVRQERAGVPREAAGRLEQNGPLLTTAWFQRYPYDRLCPIGDGGRCAAGCGPVAVAQIMNYHSWPYAGVGGDSYTWDGDQSCGGTSPGGTISATFSDPYPWNLMPDSCTAGCSEAEQLAAAELCYEVGVAAHADWGGCGSSIYANYLAGVLVESFHYSLAQCYPRQSYSEEEWFAMIRAEIDARRPIQYLIPDHMLVCDGWRTINGDREIHYNSAGGFGGNYRGWWILSEIPGSDPEFDSMYCGLVPRARLRANGTGDFATIQAAINAFSQEGLIELEDGIYQGAGNRDLDLHGKRIRIVSVSGNAEACLLDCGGSAGEYHRALRLTADQSVEVKGVGFRNGYADRGGILLLEGGASAVLDSVVIRSSHAAGYGGAIDAGSGSSVSVSNVLFDSNVGATGGAVSLTASNMTAISCRWRMNQAANGGALWFRSSQADLDRCTAFGNSAGARGGAIRGESTTLHIAHSTFCGNGANGGAGGIDLDSASGLALERSIIAFGPAGAAIACGTSGINVSCTDLFGNAGGNWTGSLAGQEHLNGNLAADPLFCDRTHDDFTIHVLSPCVEEQNPDCGLIGAWPRACGAGGIFEMRADGLGEYPTIQSAIDAAVDSVLILLAPGTYRGPGNWDLRYRGKAITIRSRERNPETCTIDCADSVYQHVGASFISGEGPQSVLEGVTIKNSGSAVSAAVTCQSASPTIINCIFSDNWSGAAAGSLTCSGGSPRIERCRFERGVPRAVHITVSSPTLVDCVFSENSTSGSGGALRVDVAAAASIIRCEFRDNSASSGGAVSVNTIPTFTDCRFEDNVADFGGAIAVDVHGYPTMIGCTFARNRAALGGAIAYVAGSGLDLNRCTLYGNISGSGGGSGVYTSGSTSVYQTIENTIIAFGVGGEAVRCWGRPPILSCCDLFGNAGGNWTGCIAGQFSTDGNFALDPAFCDTAATDLRLNISSPCMPFRPQNPLCDLIGAWGVGCPVANAPETSDAGEARSFRVRGQGGRWLFELPSATVGPASVEIYDVGGRRIRALRAETAPEIAAGLWWNGDDGTGRRVSSGLYFAKLRRGVRGGDRVLRLLVVR